MQVVGSGTERGVLRRSPLHAAHVALGARLVTFAGWEMPLSYGGGTVAEHRACRTAAAAFDVSHLGTVRVDETHGFDRLQSALCNDLGRIGPGRAQYSQLLDDDGSVLDDVIVWWTDEHRFDVMPNAANTDRVLAAVGGTDTTDARAVIAVQGPLARAVVAQVAPAAAAVGRMQVATFDWRGERCTAAGTGYTGEDGVECAVPAELAPAFWSSLLGAGAVPAGLGARDTLRLEAGLPLHGHELGPGITPLQVGLSWAVGWDKAEFRGRDALVRERAAGPRRRLWGLLAEGRQPPRDGNRVTVDGSDAGVVTSGNFSPMRGRGIALALLDTSAGVTEGTAAAVAARHRDLPVRVVPTRFWPVPGER